MCTYKYIYINGVPSGVINHGVLENGPFVTAFPMKTSIYIGFSSAMFDYQKVKNMTADWGFP